MSVNKMQREYENYIHGIYFAVTKVWQIQKGSNTSSITSSKYQKHVYFWTGSMTQSCLTLQYKNKTIFDYN